MKAVNLSPARIFAIVLVAGLSVALISWDFRQEQLGPQEQSSTDTIPSDKKRDGKVRDLDEAIAELDRLDIEKEMRHAMDEAGKALREVDIVKMQLDIEKSLKDLDLDKIRLEVEAGISKVDFEKIQKEIQEAMRDVEVDLKEAQQEMEKAMKSIDMDKIRAEVKASLDKVDWENIKAELETAKKVDLREVELELKKAEAGLKNMGPELRKSLDEARVEIEKAKKDLYLYKELVDGLDNDGLIDKKKDYTISHSDGKLVVNGKEVSASVYNKYRKMLDQKKQFRIKKSEDGFNIDNQED